MSTARPSGDWQPEPGGLAELVQCLKDAETGDSATQRAVLEVNWSLYNAI